MTCYGCGRQNMPDASGFTIADMPLDTPPPVDAKRPLFRPLAPAPAFPVRALGALRPAAEAVQMCTQAPIAICAQSVLAAVTLAVQAHRDVELPGGGRRPLTGIFASVAESGERKSSVDRIALAPVHRIEEKWRQDHGAQMQSYASVRGRGGDSGRHGLCCCGAVWSGHRPCRLRWSCETSTMTVRGSDDRR